jgi:cytochrome c-type biogenesis protein CcmH/NrfG
MKLDPKDSHYVLQALVARRKVAARHVREVLRDRDREIATLRRRLAELEELGARAVGKATAEASRTAARIRRRLSPKVRALRRQQGQYMGLVRRLKPAEKARVRAIREKKGLPAAIRLALSLGRR